MQIARVLAHSQSVAFGAAVPPARTPAPGRVKKQNKRQKAAPCATAHGAVFGVKIALSNHFFISNEIF